ncbi:BRD4-interacting chromatin-remodeling complex-associated protein-like isoform X1 [Syngnathus typhle]|uniref:BRD4-interacting chromatin-remodeling complex-associated protein-like isoform X1 n=1 Tax=Syngnathus typhle TaxID=161592 RepID=UPI002A6A31CC|nr:BRD4-interacting chromatin-remodeling complex-associated protein-like isoform X1 [Syngnathus typhle]XP_061120618.1 BRD4-interacting chromatin-remodeling complex-associated protein-like isoform X1 [Syngnathus typhle]
MDDEDDRHLLDILGDVDALNDYLHGNNSKSIEEDDVANAAYGSDASFFSGDASNTGLKDDSSSMAEFGGDPSGDSLHLSSSLSFIEDQLGSGSPPGASVDLGEDQPFDILQKSLLEADITEQTLAQDALLETQPAPTLVQAPASLPSQKVSGGYGGGVVTTPAATLPAGQFLQGVSPLPNGSTQHIQVLGSFGAGSGVMTLSGLERAPQIVLRPAGPIAAGGSPAPGGQVYAPTQGHLGQVGFKNIPLQNVIIQRGPGGTQTLIRPIQPKPHQAGAQTVFSLQPTVSQLANVTNSATPQYTANGSMVVDQQQAQANIQAGQFLLPASLAVHNGPPVDPAAHTNAHNAVQIVAGQKFTAQAGGQLILNQGPASGGTAQTWTTAASTTSAPGRLALVSQAQPLGSPVQRLLVTQTANCTSLSPLNNAATPAEEHRQNASGAAVKQVQLNAQKRPAPAPLTKGGMILQQLREHHERVDMPDRRHFTSFSDVLQRLLPYHVFQGTPPSQEEFSQVDEEFESVATHVLMRTQAMINKYRRLLLAESEQHSSPSSEMVMIDRTFNQEERSCLTQDKRMLLVDPDAFLEDFCCGLKSKRLQDPVPSPPSPPATHSEEPAYRTDSQPGFGDPGGGGGSGTPLQASSAANKNILELKRSQQHLGQEGNHSSSVASAGGHTDHQPASPLHLDTDSALEAAVNSILEC